MNFLKLLELILQHKPHAEMFYAKASENAVSGESDTDKEDSEKDGSSSDSGSGAKTTEGPSSSSSLNKPKGKKDNQRKGNKSKKSNKKQNSGSKPKSDTQYKEESTSSISSSKFTYDVKLAVTPPLGETSSYSVVDGQNYINNDAINFDVNNNSYSLMKESSSSVISVNSITRKNLVKVMKYPQGILTNEVIAQKDALLMRDTQPNFAAQDLVDYPHTPKIINKSFVLNISGHLNLSHTAVGEYFSNNNGEGIQNLVPTTLGILRTDLAYNHINITQAQGNTYMNMITSDLNVLDKFSIESYSYIGGNHNPYGAMHMGIVHDQTLLPNYNAANTDVSSFNGDMDTVDMFNNLLAIRDNIQKVTIEETFLNKGDTKRARYLRPFMRHYSFIASALLPS